MWGELQRRFCSCHMAYTCTQGCLAQTHFIFFSKVTSSANNNIHSLQAFFQWGRWQWPASILSVFHTIQTAVSAESSDCHSEDPLLLQRGGLNTFLAKGKQPVARIRKAIQTDNSWERTDWHSRKKQYKDLSQGYLWPSDGVLRDALNSLNQFKL